MGDYSRPVLSTTDINTMIGNFNKKNARPKPKTFDAQLSRYSDKATLPLSPYEQTMAFRAKKRATVNAPITAAPTAPVIEEIPAFNAPYAAAPTPNTSIFRAAAVSPEAMAANAQRLQSNADRINRQNTDFISSTPPAQQGVPTFQAPFKLPAQGIAASSLPQKIETRDAGVPALEAKTVGQTQAARSSVRAAPVVNQDNGQGNYWIGSDGVRRDLTWDAKGNITSGLRNNNDSGVAADRAANQRAILNSAQPLYTGDQKQFGTELKRKY